MIFAIGIDLQQYRVRIANARTVGACTTGKKCKYQRYEPCLTSTSILTLIYATIMTYLLPLLFKAYIISTASMQAKMSSSQITLKMSKFYPFIDLSSVLIFLTLSKFTNKGIIAKTPSLTTFTPISISVCLLFFTYYIKINYSFINCFLKAPDIILLNETWLKPSINSNEIIPGKSYKIFRKDRSPLSHPPDPNTPGKFKLNGGGVLIE